MTVATIAIVSGAATNVDKAEVREGLGQLAVFPSNLHVSPGGYLARNSGKCICSFPTAVDAVGKAEPGRHTLAVR